MGDGIDGELAQRDRAREQQRRAGAIERGSRQASTGDKRGKSDAVGGGREFGQEAGRIGQADRHQRGDRWVARGGGRAGDVGVVSGIGCDGGGCGVAVDAGQVSRVDEACAGRGEALDEAVLRAARRRRLPDGAAGDGQVGAVEIASDEDGVGGRGHRGRGDPAAAGEGEEDLGEGSRVKASDERVGRGVGAVRDRGSGRAGQGGGGGGAGHVDVAERVKRHGQADVSLRPDEHLRQDVRTGRIRLEDADAVVLVQQQKEIAGDVSFDSGDLALGTGAAQTRKGELLGLVHLRRQQGGERKAKYSKVTAEPTRNIHCHGSCGCGDAQVAACPQYPSWSACPEAPKTKELEIRHYTVPKRESGTVTLAARRSCRSARERRGRVDRVRPRRQLAHRSGWPASRP